MKEGTIMKKLFAVAAFAAATMLGVSQAQAQTYKTGAGVLVDFGDGSTFVGPHVKHFFKANHAGEFSVLFADGATLAASTSPSTIFCGATAVRLSTIITEKL